MNLNQAAKMSGAVIRCEYDLTERPSKVWRALTDADLLSVWLMPNDIRAEVGHRFTFRGQPRPGWDGIIHCEVLEVVLEQRLVYSWRGGSSQQDTANHLDTVVAWTLMPTAEGTKLLLEHSGFEPEGFAFQAMSQGWKGKVAQRLNDMLSRMQ